MGRRRHAAPDARLARARETYRYDRTTLAPFTVAAEVPVEERFPVEYHVAMLEAVVLAGRNLALAQPRGPDDRFGSLREAAGLFTLLDRPDAVVEHHAKDWAFAEQRLAGPNPMVLRAVQSREELRRLCDKAPVEDAHVSFAAHDLRGLEAAVEAGRLFVADYELLDGLPPATWNGRRKYLTAPVAWFCWRTTGQGDRGELTPIAIQLGQRPDASPMFTPQHDTWPAAKLCVQVADANHHEMVSHLGWTHLALEPFAIATPRQLAEEHPIRRLIAPHLRLLIARNAEARARLINPDGPVDELMGSSLEGSLELARRGRCGWGTTPGWGLLSHGFEAHLRGRGLWAGRLPHFPYRDDGMLLWAAIGELVRGYLATVYPTQRALADDAQLHAWVDELRDPRRGAVPGLPAVTDVKTLAEVLQTLIFTAGPQHAATNYPQYEYMGFAPNMPLAGYAPPPATTHLGAGQDGAPLQHVPPFAQAVRQLIIVHGLSAHRPDRLGDDLPQGPEVARVCARFTGALRDAEERIARRNRVRRLPYPYLLPSRVPNGSSV